MTYNWFQDRRGTIWADDKSASYSLNRERNPAFQLVPTKEYIPMENILKAAEALVQAIKDAAGATTAPAKKGNRTPATKSYRGGNAVQDLVDSVRRAVRVSRTGGDLTKKERNIMRKVVKGAKAVSSYGIVNTNGVDVFTQHGA